VRHHAGNGEANPRAAVARIVAVVPGGILHDCLAADLVEGDGLGALSRGGGHRQDFFHEAGKFNGPLEHLHAAHRAAGDGVERGEAEVVAEEFLRAHHVADGDKGKRDAEGPARARVDGGRPG